MTLPYARRQRAFAAFVAACGCALLVTACPETPEPESPNAPVDKQRETELTHEDCDIESSSAVREDANGDGRPEIITLMNGAVPVCRAVDANMDGVWDMFVYYDGSGALRRREKGFDRDTRPDEISHYQAGTIVLKERETNNDKKIDTWDYYENGLLARGERDSTGDGFIDQWWTFNQPNKPGCAVVVSDSDGDGKPEPESQLDICNEDKPAAAPTPPPKADGGGGAGGGDDAAGGAAASSTDAGDGGAGGGT